MITLTDILRQFNDFNISVEVHENPAIPDYYNIMIEYGKSYWFFGFFSKIKVQKFMKKLERLIDNKMAGVLAPLSDVHYSLYKEKTGIMAETYTGKLRFTLEKSPVSELADYFYKYHSIFVYSNRSFYDSRVSSEACDVYSFENKFYYFSNLY